MNQFVNHFKPILICMAFFINSVIAVPIYYTFEGIIIEGGARNPSFTVPEIGSLARLVFEVDRDQPGYYIRSDIGIIIEADNYAGDVFLANLLESPVILGGTGRTTVFQERHYGVEVIGSDPRIMSLEASAGNPALSFQNVRTVGPAFEIGNLFYFHADATQDGIVDDAFWNGNFTLTSINNVYVPSPSSSTSAVPEPSSFAMLGMGLVGAFFIRKRISKNGLNAYSNKK